MCVCENFLSSPYLGPLPSSPRTCAQRPFMRIANKAAAFPPLQPRACPGYIPALFPRFWAGTWAEIYSLPGRRARPAGARRPAVRTDAISAFRFVWNPHRRTQRHEAAPLSAPPRGTVHSFTSSYANTTDFPLTVESLADAFAFARSISTSPPREPSCLSA